MTTGLWESGTGNVKGINRNSGPEETVPSTESFIKSSKVCFNFKAAPEFKMVSKCELVLSTGPGAC